MNSKIRTPERVELLYQMKKMAIRRDRVRNGKCACGGIVKHSPNGKVLTCTRCGSTYDPETGKRSHARSLVAW